MGAGISMVARERRAGDFLAITAVAQDWALVGAREGIFDGFAEAGAHRRGL